MGAHSTSGRYTRGQIRLQSRISLFNSARPKLRSKIHEQDTVCPGERRWRGNDKRGDARYDGAALGQDWQTRLLDESPDGYTRIIENILSAHVRYGTQTTRGKRLQRANKRAQSEQFHGIWDRRYLRREVREFCTTYRNLGKNGFRHIKHE